MFREDSILERNDYKYYAGCARDVYEECCERFGWAWYKSGCFTRQKLLYAPDATPEAYSVWFMCHNNWTKTESEKWVNHIYPDKNTIDQIWKVAPPYDPFPDLAPRVIFAKNIGGYQFLGVYEITPMRSYKLSNGKIEWVTTYKCISKSYPMKSMQKVFHTKKIAASLKRRFFSATSRNALVRPSVGQNDAGMSGVPTRHPERSEGSPMVNGRTVSPGFFGRYALLRAMRSCALRSGRMTRA